MYDISIASIYNFVIMLNMLASAFKYFAQNQTDVWFILDYYLRLYCLFYFNF